MDALLNFLKQPVDGGHDSVVTTISVDDASNFPDPTVDGNYNLTWWNGTTFPDPTDDPNVELVRVTSRNVGGNTLTVTRAQEGTSATSKNTASAQYLLALTVTKKTITDIYTEIDNIDITKLIDSNGNDAVLTGATASATTEGVIYEAAA